LAGFFFPLNPFANCLRVAECETRNRVFSHENDSWIVLCIDDEFFKDFSSRWAPGDAIMRPDRHHAAAAL